jgi:hypothetical protein
MIEELGSLMFCGSSCTICEAYEAEKTLKLVKSARNPPQIRNPPEIFFVC